MRNKKPPFEITNQMIDQVAEILMNQKIQKIVTEIEKVKSKIATQQARLREQIGRAHV